MSLHVLKPVVAGLLGLALIISPAVADPKYGGVLKLYWGTLDTTDFHRHTGTISLTHPFAETLTSVSKDGQPKPFLAESWQISSDGLTYTFKIREGVKFHNGDTMTAKDVLANFSRIRAEVKKGWLTSAMEPVDRFEAPDDRTFIVIMKTPFSPFLNLIAEAWILSPKSPGWDKTISHPIGTGPFTFDNWTPQVVLKGKKFSDYWMKGKPYVDAVEFDVRELADASLAVRSGDLHGAEVPLSKRSILGEDKNVTLDFRGDTSWYFVSFNNKTPRAPFNDLRVRQAISYAIDKPAILNLSAGESGQLVNQMAAPGNFYYDKAMADADPHRQPNLDKARALLKEANVDPAKVTVRLIGEATDRSVAPIVQMIKRLGFNVENKAYDDLGYQKALSGYEWDIFPGGSGPRNDIFLRFVRLMSDGPNPHLWGGVTDLEFDRLVREASISVDDTKRRALYLAAWQRVIDNYYTVAIGHTPALYAYRKELRDMSIGFNTSAHRADGGIAFAWFDR